MSTISTTTRRSANMNIVFALAITLVVIMAFVVSQSVVAPKPAVAPISESQNAYVEYLRGEKTIYANPAGLNQALSAYHLGEKTQFEAALDINSALSQFIAGEKVVFENPMDIAATMTAYHIGEKIVVPSLESAMLEYRLGEKELK